MRFVAFCMRKGQEATDLIRPTLGPRTAAATNPLCFRKFRRLTGVESIAQKGVSIRVRRITSAMDLQAFVLEAMGALCAARAVDYLAAHSFLAYG